MSINNWFGRLVGFPETRDNITEKIVLTLSDNGSCALRSRENDKEFDVGVFTTPSLEELRQKCKSFLQRGKNSLTVEVADVAAKIATSRYSTFQVASQFNCLEFVSQHVTPEEGVTGYVRDRTQGPACAIACGPATIFRNYFVPVKNGKVADDANKEDFKGQTRDEQINCIREFELEALSGVGGLEGDFFKLEGGYTMTDREKLARFNDAMTGEDVMRRVESKLRVGMHSDVQVTSQNWGQTSVDDAEHKVTQVFGSACPISYNRCTSESDWEKLAKMVLNASYEATLWAALLNAVRHDYALASNCVYLTCLGGGVFGNPTSWILEAIKKALIAVEGYNLDVRIVCYGFLDPEVDSFVKQFTLQASVEQVEDPEG